ncbi:MAG TPA: hypothetical protein VGQ99_01430, partial [Tepidisphaeraceae bacterium]|nr:hypothetical protein [Tepidisphaeraceae bacterium]
TSPGRYELSLPAPTTPTFATILHHTQLLDRLSLPARYAPEFDSLGNDDQAMKSLASATNGAVIPPTDSRPIHFNFPRNQLPLSSWLAVAAALFIASGLILWRLR